LRCALGATMAEQRTQLWTDEGCIVLMPAILITTALVMIFPEIALFLPRALK